MELIGIQETDTFIDRKSDPIMKRFMMKFMMPMMGGTISKMPYEDKANMMDHMMPHMMTNLSTAEKLDMMQKMMPEMLAGMTAEEKQQMMQTMMPLMIQEIEAPDMESMMHTMMPIMMNQMKIKGIPPVEMMRNMCPRCISLVKDSVSVKERNLLKAELESVFSEF